MVSPTIAWWLSIFLLGMNKKKGSEQLSLEHVSGTDLRTTTCYTKHGSKYTTLEFPTTKK